MVVTVTCPACWQPTAVEVHVSEGTVVEQYEDCQVCCRPMRIRATMPPFEEHEGAPGEPYVEVELDG